MSVFEYGAVARKSTILAQYADASGNFDVMSADIFKRLSSKDVNFACEKDGHKFYVYHDEENQLNFVISGSLSMQSKAAYDFLDSIRKIFFQKFQKSAWDQAKPYGLQNEFSNIIKQYMTTSKVSLIKDNLADTEQLMQDSLQTALLRGKQLDDINDTALTIELSSKDYSRQAKQIKMKMCCQRYRYFIIIAIALLVVIIIVSISVSSSKKKKKE